MHPATSWLLSAASVLIATAMAATPGPAAAQPVTSFSAWTTDLGKVAQTCPTADVPPAQQATNPYFKFNGDPTVAGFGCQQVGPFPSLNTPHGPWFMQNVKGLKPNGCGPASCRTNAVRMCSLKAAGLPNVTGPFGGVVGPAGCEKLWVEEYQAPAP
jgi:hypothetical protein